MHYLMLWRMELKVHRTELALGLKVAVDTIVAWEKGLAAPTTGQVRRWVRFLHTVERELKKGLRDAV